MSSYKKFFFTKSAHRKFKWQKQKGPCAASAQSQEWFCQVLWGTNMSVKADLDKRHVKEEPMKGERIEWGFEVRECERSEEKEMQQN